MWWKGSCRWGSMWWMREAGVCVWVEGGVAVVEAGDLRVI